MIFKVNIFNSF